MLGNINMCKIFVEQGSEINSQDSTGKTPLHHACNAVGNSYEVIELLLSQPSISGTNKKKKP